MTTKYDGKRIIRTTERYAELTDDEKWTEEEQIEECCAPQPEADECTDYPQGRITAWAGVQLPPQCTPGDPDCIKFDPQAIYNSHKARMGDRLVGYKLVPKARQQPCGKKIQRWEDKYGCCVCPPDPLWKTNTGTNVQWVDWYQSYNFFIEDGAGVTGTPPYTWETVGRGLSIVGNNLSARLSVGDCFCNPGLVIAKDACGVEILYFIYLNGGSLEAYSDTSFDSNYGWPQDGLVDQPPLVRFYVYGQNEDLTIQSVQSFSRGWAAIGPEGDEGQFACAAGIAEEYYDSSPVLAVPVGEGIDGLNGFQQCDGVNVWWKDYTGICEHPDGFPIRYYFAYNGPGASRGTVEWSFDGCQYNELVIDPDNSIETLSNNSSGWVYYLEGWPPFEIRVSGQDCWADADRSTVEYTTSEQRVQVFTGPDACGPLRVDITDACGQKVNWTARVTVGVWELISDAQLSPCVCYGDFDYLGTDYGGNRHGWRLDQGQYRQEITLHKGVSGSGEDIIGGISVKDCDLCPTSSQINSYGAVIPADICLDPVTEGITSWYPCYHIPSWSRLVCSYQAARRSYKWVCP